MTELLVWGMNRYTRFRLKNVSCMENVSQISGSFLGGVLCDRVLRGTIALSTLFVVRIFGYLRSIRSLMSAISSCLSHTCTRFGQVTRAVTCDRWSIWMSSLVRFCLDIEMLNGSGASSGFLE